LTQNVVDGLGPTGTEGLFTTAAVTTLAMLRQNSSALLTILSAVVSDPLYSWSMSPVKARERQALVGDDGENDDPRASLRREAGSAEASAAADNDFGSDPNEAAAAAISKIKEKLQGYEDGTSGEQQSVQSQIQLLINSARDPDKLSEMFHGWSAWV
jgi:ataxia telangiectasia mutated family protein